jgi:hypothetical protein
MNTTMATEFSTRCFRPGETIAVLLRREEPPKLIQRIVRLEQAIAPAYMRWLAHENASGMNIYVAANPLHSGSRKRTKECIADVRHLYLDIDGDADTRIAALRASDTIPEPTAIVSTSCGKCQVLWRVEGFDFGLQELTLKQLAVAFGGDPACTDCNRVIRLPGFHNAKYTPAYPIAVEFLSDSVSNPDDFRLESAPLEFSVQIPRMQRSTFIGKRTHSEQDWAWVLMQLSNGKDPIAVTGALALHRADKPNPLYYAQRTVDIASARIALLAGTAIRDVITSLETRRSSHFPAALCSARAREITHTAAQMIARQKLA